MNQSFYIKEWKVEPGLNKLVKNGATVKLEPRLMSFLLVLAENSGQVVTKEELLDRVWGDTFVSEQVLKVTVSELRKILGDNARDPVYIKTISKKGYLLLEKTEEDQIIEKNPSDISSSPAKTFFSSKNYPGLAVIILLLMVLIALPFYFREKKTVSKTENSIAVLPIKDVSDALNKDFFSEGLTETITTSLAKSPNLKVISSRSALTFKNSNKKASVIAEELGVANLLAGTIFRNGNQIRLSMRLIHGRTEEVLWAENYQGDLERIFIIQNELSRAVSKKLSPEISITGQNQKVNSEAYEAYLQGRFLWNKRNPKELKESLEYFQKAIDLEPQNGLFYSGLADAYTLLAFYKSGGEENYQKKAKASAQKALQFNPESAEAHTSIGGIMHKHDVNLKEAEKNFLKAIKLNPNYSTGHQWYAIFLASTGKCSESLERIEKAIELDPLSMVMRTDKGWLLYMCGKNKEAIRKLEDVEKLSPNYGASYFLILAYSNEGLYEKALQIIEKAFERRGTQSPYPILEVYVNALSGKTVLAKRKLNSINQKEKYPYETGLAFLALDEKHTALDYFEKVVEKKSSWQPFLKSQPELKPLLQNPRYQKLLQKIGLN